MSPVLHSMIGPFSRLCIGVTDRATLPPCGLVAGVSLLIIPAANCHESLTLFSRSRGNPAALLSESNAKRIGIWSGKSSRAILQRLCHVAVRICRFNRRATLETVKRYVEQKQASSP
jgi:hypothetical protein